MLWDGDSDLGWHLGLVKAIPIISPESQNFCKLALPLKSPDSFGDRGATTENRLLAPKRESFPSRSFPRSSKNPHPCSKQNLFNENRGSIVSGYVVSLNTQIDRVFF
jgi:hypothetical protein